MMNKPQDPNGEGGACEIVLIRRRCESDDDERHGGVWKVAFADFMTAMMAFFLVLWIVNSTTKETRSSLARYFNPVRLSDTTPARKGLKDPKEEDFDAGLGPRRAPAIADHVDRRDERAGAQAQPVDGAVETRDGLHDPGAGAAAIGASYHDPFARSPEAAEKDEERTRTGSDARAAPEPPVATTAAAARALTAELARSLGEEFSRLGDALEVTPSGDDLLISLTDRTEFGMFAIGSATPEPRLVRVLEAIGRALQGRGGDLVVRGHTDARPFRRTGFDNWLLSTARAQTATRMLIGAGIDERRIERIEGYADRRLKRPEAPEAPENRRIEILLRKEAT